MPEKYTLPRPVVSAEEYLFAQVIELQRIAAALEEINAHLGVIRQGSELEQSAMIEIREPKPPKPKRGDP